MKRVERGYEPEQVESVVRAANFAFNACASLPFWRWKSPLAEAEGVAEGVAPVGSEAVGVGVIVGPVGSEGEGVADGMPEDRDPPLPSSSLSLSLPSSLSPSGSMTQTIEGVGVAELSSGAVADGVAETEGSAVALAEGGSVFPESFPPPTFFTF